VKTDETNPNRLLTGDRNLSRGRMEKMSTGDLALLKDVASGQGVAVTPDEFRALAASAQLVYEDMRRAVAGLTREQASSIVKLWEAGYTMRAIARRFWLPFGMKWEPADNQIAGHALLERTDELTGSSLVATVQTHMEQQLRALLDEAGQ
jgi:hypothetical protein